MLTIFRKSDYRDEGKDIAFGVECGTECGIEKGSFYYLPIIFFQGWDRIESD